MSKLEDLIREALLRERGESNAYGRSPDLPGSPPEGGVSLGGVGGPRSRGAPGYPIPRDLRARTHSSPTGEPPKSIPHIDDLRPDELEHFLSKLSGSPGSLEISEKVDGSARMSFGPTRDGIWTKTKNGTVRERSGDYPDSPAYRAVRAAHRALESRAREIRESWPAGVDALVAEVLHTRVPNSIEYGPNAVIVHGVVSQHRADARLAAEAVTRAAGELTDGSSPWKFEYKRTVPAFEISVDLTEELRELRQARALGQAGKQQLEAAKKRAKAKLVEMLRKQRSAYGPEGGDVEGLVLLDPGTGKMTKIVDKDTFTKLNSFLWQFREMIEKGARGEDGKWAPGVMQRFRNRMAEEVIGDPVAKTPMLVRTIATKHGGGGPSKALARYVSERGLLLGDFVQGTRKLVERALAELEELRLRWESFKATSPTLELGGKMRRFAPEHVQRTDESFREARAFLEGFGSGLLVTEGVSDDLTRRVAVMRLFLGHRYERLSELSGRIDELRQQPSLPADPLVTAVIARDAEKLKKRGIDAAGAPVLGEGAYGVAFGLPDGRVLKITTDLNEAKSAKYLLDKGAEHKHIARYYDVFKFQPINAKQLYGVVLERLAVKDDEAFTHAMFELDQASALLRRDVYTDPQVTWEMAKRAYLQSAGDDPQKLQSNIDKLESRQFGEMFDELKSHGISHVDMHAENMGQRADGTWVVFDIGAGSKSPGSSDIPLLEGAGDWLRAAAAATVLGVSSPAAGAPPKSLQHFSKPATAGVEKHIADAAKKHGVPAKLIRAIIQVESTGRASAVSDKGAQGLMQLMPATAKWLGVRDSHDPAQNIHGGAKYLKILMKRFGNDLDKVLAAWNYGPTAARKTPPEQWPSETKNFIKKVRERLGSEPLALKSEAAFQWSLAGSKGSTTPSSDYEDIVTRVRNSATSHVQKFSEKIRRRTGEVPGKRLGTGTQADVFELGSDKALKITHDVLDAKMSLHVKSHPLEHVVRVYDVFHFPPVPGLADVYGIVVERLRPLDQDARDAVEDVEWLLNSADGRRWEDIERFLSGIKSAETAEVVQAYGFNALLDELASIGFVGQDFHSGNFLMRADGTIVLSDLGFSQSPRAQEMPPVLEGGPIDRMTPPTDLSGKNVKPDDPDLTLESVIGEALLGMLSEAGQKRVGVTIGRFQPFHAGHAEVIRSLTREFSSVIVFVAGQKQDRENPFSHETRLKMIELSLPDVWSKVKVFPATIQGKGTGYVPGLLANLAASKEAGIAGDEAVTLLVGEDRLAANQKQAQHNDAHRGQAGYFGGTIEVRALPGVKSDDVAGRISGTRVREALAKNDKQSVMSMLDKRLATGSEAESVYSELREQLRAIGLVSEIVEAIVTEVGMGGLETGVGWTRGGAWGSSGWSRGTIAKDMTGDEVYQQMLRSPSTRMLQMANHGVPNDHLPGQDEPGEDSEHNKPTDLGEVVAQVVKSAVESVDPWAVPSAYRKMTLDERRAREREARRRKREGLPPLEPWPRKPARAKPAPMPRTAKRVTVEERFRPWSPDNSVKWTASEASRQSRREICESADDEDDAAQTLGIGNGEHRFCWEVCRQKGVPYDPDGLVGEKQIQKTADSFDVLVGGETYEVKEIDDRKSKASQTIRVAKSGFDAVYEFRLELDSFLRFVEAVDRELVPTDDATLWIKSRLREFIDGRVRPKSRPNAVRLRSGSVLPSDVQRVTEVCKILSIVYDWPQLQEAKVKMGDRLVSLGRAVQAARAIRESYFPSKWVEDPQEFKREWERLGNVQNFFPEHVQNIAIVTRSGYACFRRDEAQRYLKFHGMSLGFAHLRLVSE